MQFELSQETQMSTKSTDAVSLLVADHKKVAGLFAEFGEANSLAKQSKLVAQICDELTIHTMIEEEILYPALRGKLDDDKLDEAYVEHDGAKALVCQLRDADPSEQYYQAKVKVLSEDIEHHVEEEEKPRDGLFARAAKADVDLDELGAKLAARKEELLKLAKAGDLPPPQLLTTEAA
ncbi:MAG: hemerythrin domain-containing protein [Novosphingobium sp.]